MRQALQYNRLRSNAGWGAPLREASPIVATLKNSASFAEGHRHWTLELMVCIVTQHLGLDMWRGAIHPTTR